MLRHRSFVSLAPLFLFVLALVACGRRDAAPSQDATVPAAGSDVALPKPEANGGSVTGMPATPGPNPVGPAPEVDATADENATGDAGAQDETPASEADATTAGDQSEGDAPIVTDEPSAQDAADAVRAYYAAINQHDYQRAWASWSDGGRSSGQTPQQFADGFANTAQVALQTGPPGAMEGAAGSRYIEVPVTIDATQRDGSVHHYVGTYTLRRAMVDGATDIQRAWHIASASLRETGQ